MHSHHSHSGQFCKHAVGMLEEVVQTAIAKGFSMFGLSEHVPRYRRQDLYPEEMELTLEHLSNTFDEYVTEAHRVREAHSSQISLLIGLETDYITSLDLDELEQQLKRYGDRIEYLVGSVHHVHQVPLDYGKDLFDQVATKLSVEATASMTESSSRQQPFLDPLICHYLDMQLEVMQRFHPEIIGHFDLFRLYYPSYRLSSEDTPEVWSKIQRNVAFAINYGALFELNAAAFRKGWDQAYPGKEIAELIISLGGRFALSDDSHGPPAVGLNYSRLRTYAKETLGLQEIWHLERCQERNTGGRLVRAVKWGGAGEDWSEQNFWEKP